MKKSIRNIFLLCVLIASSLSSFAADEVSFTMSASKVVREGDQFRLTLSLNQQGSNIKLPKMSQFDVLMGPSTSSSSSVQVINGNVTRTASYSYTYILRSKKQGKFKVQGAKVSVDGKSYTSNGIEIQVIAPSANKPQSQSSGTQQRQQQTQSSTGTVGKDDLFARVDLSKTTLYKGEHLVATVKLYSRVNLSGLDGANFPNYEGFWSQEIETPQQAQRDREVYNNEIYDVYTLKKTLLFPQKSGEITIDPVDIDVRVRQRVRRSQGFFDDFFDNYRTVSVKAVSKKRVLKVKALPSIPANYSGGVGNFKLTSTISETKVKENDAITLRVKLSGIGNLKLVDAPELKLPADFDVYDPQQKENFKIAETGMNGSVTYEYLFQPRFGGTYTVPAVEFVYFDPTKKQYITRKGKEFTIEVEKGSNVTAQGPVVNSFAKEDVRFIGKDIRFIRTGKLRLRAKGTTFFATPLYYGICGLSILLLLVFYLLNQKRIRENANVVGMKNKRANKVAQKRLKAASVFLKSKDKEKFYEEIMHAFWGYLSDKLSMPLSQLTKESAKRTLLDRKVEETLVDEFISMIDTCEFARFAPVGGEDEMDRLYKQAADLMGKMEKQIKKK